MRTQNWPVKILSSVEVRSAAIGISCKTWSVLFQAVDGLMTFELEFPPATALRSYHLYGQDLKNILICPLFTPSIEASFLINGQQVLVELVWTTEPLESDSMCGKHGRTAHYLLYTEQTQSLKGNQLLTNISLDLEAGWNLVYCEPAIIIGHNLRATQHPNTSMSLQNAPSGGWFPIQKCLPSSS